MTEHKKKTGTTYRFGELQQRTLTKLLARAQSQQMAKLTENDYLQTLIMDEWQRVIAGPKPVQP